MYQLATSRAESSAARHFLEAASVTPATPASLAFVGALTDSLRVALCAGNIEPLRIAVLHAEKSGTDVHDLLAAAEYELTDSLLDQGLAVLHDAATRLGSIIRDVRHQADAGRLAEPRSRRRQAVTA
jgi:hypothetical protein